MATTIVAIPIAIEFSKPIANSESPAPIAINGIATKIDAINNGTDTPINKTEK